MAAVISVDRAGRLVIPKELREKLGVEKDTKFLVMSGEHGVLMLQKLDVEEIAARLEEELKGVDVDAIVREVRDEINEKARKRYPKLFS